MTVQLMKKSWLILVLIWQFGKCKFILSEVVRTIEVDNIHTSYESWCFSFISECLENIGISFPPSPIEYKLKRYYTRVRGVRITKETLYCKQMAVMQVLHCASKCAEFNTRCRSYTINHGTDSATCCIYDIPEAQLEGHMEQNQNTDLYILMWIIVKLYFVKCFHGITAGMKYILLALRCKWG